MFLESECMQRKHKLVVYRLIRIIGRIFYRRRIWLVSDRSTIAVDNGEAFLNT